MSIGASWEGQTAEDTLHIWPGPDLATWARASPLLLWSVQKTRAGTQAENQPKEGTLVPDTQIWLGKGSNIPWGGVERAPRDYIKPELGDRQSQDVKPHIPPSASRARGRAAGRVEVGRVAGRTQQIKLFSLGPVSSITLCPRGRRFKEETWLWKFLQTHLQTI